MKKILVVDDHAIVRKGLKEIINESEDFIVKAEAKNSEEALVLIRNTNFDIIVLDINMPGRSGFDIIPDIKKIRNNLPILILSINPEGEFGMRCLQAGASGYMNKDIEPDEFLFALRRIHSGQKYIPPVVAEILLRNYGDKKEFNRIDNVLSNREFEVLRMIAKRRSLKEISNDLSLSIKTVSTYKTRIMQKLDLKDNEQLLKYAKRKNLI